MFPTYHYINLDNVNETSTFYVYVFFYVSKYICVQSEHKKPETEESWIKKLTCNM